MTDGFVHSWLVGSGRPAGGVASSTMHSYSLLRSAKLAARSKQDYWRVSREAQDVMRVGFSAGCSAPAPFPIWTQRMASRTSTSGLSTPGAAIGHFRTNGKGQRITVLRNSEDFKRPAIIHRRSRRPT